MVYASFNLQHICLCDQVAMDRPNPVTPQCTALGHMSFRGWIALEEDVDSLENRMESQILLQVRSSWQTWIQVHQDPPQRRKRLLPCWTLCTDTSWVPEQFQHHYSPSLLPVYSLAVNKHKFWSILRSDSAWEFCSLSLLVSSTPLANSGSTSEWFWQTIFLTLSLRRNPTILYSDLATFCYMLWTHISHHSYFFHALLFGCTSCFHSAGKYKQHGSARRWRTASLYKHFDNRNLVVITAQCLLEKNRGPLANLANFLM